MTRTAVHSLVGLIALAALAPSVSATDSIHLLEAAEASGPNVLLGQVAELKGTRALQLAGLAVARLDRSQQGTVVTMEHLRRVLGEQEVNLASLSLRGHTRCQVTQIRAATPPAIAPRPAPLVPNSERDVDLRSDASLYDRLVRFIGQLTDANRGELDINLSPSDIKFLSQNDEDNEFHFRLVSKPTLGKIVVAAHRMDDERVAETRYVRPIVTRRMLAVVVTRGIRPGDVVTRDNVEIREVVIDRDRGDPVRSLSAALGRIATTHLKPGAHVTANQFRNPYAIHKNDIITVRCVQGGIELKTPARADENGSVGDIIRVINERALQVSGRSRRHRAEAIFVVRVTGLRQAAVLTTPPATSDKAEPATATSWSRAATNTQG